MLKRIYIDNYKCLVNFDLQVGPLNLFLGPNGSGKSTVFEALGKLRTLVVHGGVVSAEFQLSSRTRWQTSSPQRFELELSTQGGTYRYELEVDYDSNDLVAFIRHERLWLDSRPVVMVEDRVAYFYQDDGSKSDHFRLDGSRSIVNFIPLYNRAMAEFRVCLNEVLVIRLDANLIQDGGIQSEAYPSTWGDNYAAWYRHLSQDQGLIFELTDLLKEVLPGFAFFKFSDVGEGFILKTVFNAQNGSRPTQIEYRFAELSDGQRILVVLYTLLLVAQKRHYVLCLDEPENFLALPEIQPWLLRLYDGCMDDQMQALLISHHPELIDYLLASPVGLWFDRETNTPVRVKSITHQKDEGGLPVSELIARGWLDA